MGEIEEVQERMKAYMEAMIEKIATMIEAMMSMKKIMEVNAAAVAATSVIAKVDPTPPSGLNQINHPTLDMVGRGGKELGSTGDPHFVQVQNKHAFPPYSLPPNYTPPNVSHTPDENVDSSAPIPIESQQPQSDHAHVSQPMGETREVPHHNLADFEPRLGYATEGQTVGGVPLPNTLEGPQFCPQPPPLRFALTSHFQKLDTKQKQLDLRSHYHRHFFKHRGGNGYSSKCSASKGISDMNPHQLGKVVATRLVIKDVGIPNLHPLHSTLVVRIG
ncbi:hypothetical protein GmHk_19G054935 [Glycine max]|nr:hypothetical protein GmHk_19G054935 [Glycine max]